MREFDGKMYYVFFRAHTHTHTDIRARSALIVFQVLVLCVSVWQLCLHAHVCEYFCMSVFVCLCVFSFSSSLSVPYDGIFCLVLVDFLIRRGSSNEFVSCVVCVRVSDGLYENRYWFGRSCMCMCV